MSRIYAIGDIHGHLDKLRGVHEWIEADRARTGDRDALVVHLGDLIDRGPDSRGVVQYLMDGQARGEPWIVVKGNHDAYLPRFVSPHEEYGPNWMSDGMGGRKTLESYGLRQGMLQSRGGLRDKARAEIPEAHIAYLDGLPLYHETRDLILVHAGIRPGLPMSDQVEEDLIWIRAEFLNDTRDHGKLIVHGHTPVERPEHHGNRVALDTGAGFGHALTVAVFERRKCWVLDPMGRTPLEPATPS